MACPVVNNGRPCPVASLKADPEGYCFNHSPTTAQRRAAARRQGGRAKAAAIAERKARAPAPPRSSAAPLTMGAAFELGRIDDIASIAAAAQRVARAIASGEMNIQRGRLLCEILREAREATEESTGGISQGDGRPLTDEELAYVRANGGKLPPGVKTVFCGEWRVDGDPYTGPPEGAREEAPEPEESNVIPFPSPSSGMGSPAA
jgi:hypothetical protein